MASCRLAVTLCILFCATLINCAHVKYDFTLTWEVGAPAGVSRHMILNNGQFPGPTMMLNEDDDVEVSGTNIESTDGLRSY